LCYPTVAAALAQERLELARVRLARVHWKREPAPGWSQG